MANRIFRIWDEGVCLDKQELILALGADFFVKLLTWVEYICDSLNIGNIPSLVDSRDNSALTALPTIEEVKQIIWDMRKDSVAGPDGFSVEFYMTCWEIIKDDVLGAVIDSFQGSFFPKGMTTTTIVLIPKVECAQINGNMAGFFPIKCGLKQGDPILFVIAVEFLSRGGLGVRRLSDVATTIAMKLWFWFREQKTSWAVFLASMYCGASCVVVGNHDCKVTNFMEILGWDANKLHIVVSTDFVEEISSVQFSALVEGSVGAELVGVAQSSVPDSIIWKPALDGRF
ncbi:hypothetical protein ZIOFF_058962 [Zingiber officinale]|uniref:Uncharacterized protein n=1 Tax=Zingiber officinale TaxID=94328 RepID=A0A8J5FC82_ZINOF|nr:hypothetical protein ZIOFF_058962 [Zingiber officinale]